MSEEKKEEQKVWSLKRKTFPVTIEKEDGTQKTILVREMSGAQRSDYLAALANNAKINTEGALQGIRSFKGLHSLLLIPCLVNEADKSPVPESEFGEYPGGLQDFLFTKARELNGFDVKEPAGKKDSQETSSTGTA